MYVCMYIYIYCTYIVKSSGELRQAENLVQAVFRQSGSSFSQAMSMARLRRLLYIMFI